MPMLIEPLPSRNRWRRPMCIMVRDPMRPCGTSRAGEYDTIICALSVLVSAPLMFARADQRVELPEYVSARLLASRSSWFMLILAKPPQPLIGRSDAVSDAPYDSCEATFSHVTVETPSASTIL